MKRKIIISIFIAISLAVAMYVSYDYFRLEIIRATMGLPLPGWLLAFLWGWR